jgi:hypothetical protein
MLHLGATCTGEVHIPAILELLLQKDDLLVHS